jgi:hypothetical protein
MDGPGRPRRRRNWLRIVLVVLGLPVLMYLGLMLWIGLSLSGSY